MTERRGNVRLEALSPDFQPKSFAAPESGGGMRSPTAPYAASESLQATPAPVRFSAPPFPFATRGRAIAAGLGGAVRQTQPIPPALVTRAGPRPLPSGGASSSRSSGVGSAGRRGGREGTGPAPSFQSPAEYGKAFKVLGMESAARAVHEVVQREGRQEEEDQAVKGQKPQAQAQGRGTVPAVPAVPTVPRLSLSVLEPEFVSLLEHSRVGGGAWEGAVGEEDEEDVEEEQGQDSHPPPHSAIYGLEDSEEEEGWVEGRRADQTDAALALEQARQANLFMSPGTTRLSLAIVDAQLRFPASASGVLAPAPRSTLGFMRGTPYTVYLIRVRCGLRTWMIQRRYRDFAALHAVLSRSPLLPAGRLPALPGKLTGLSRIGLFSSPDALGTRMRELQAYMRMVVRVETAWAVEGDALIVFLDDPQRTLALQSAFARMMRMTASLAGTAATADGRTIQAASAQSAASAQVTAMRRRLSALAATLRSQPGMVNADVEWAMRDSCVEEGEGKGENDLEGAVLQALHRLGHDLDRGKVGGRVDPPSLPSPPTTGSQAQKARLHAALARQRVTHAGSATLTGPMAGAEERQSAPPAPPTELHLSAVSRKASHPRHEFSQTQVHGGGLRPGLKRVAPSEDAQPGGGGVPGRTRMPLSLASLARAGKSPSKRALAIRTAEDVSDSFSFARRESIGTQGFESGHGLGLLNMSDADLDDAVSVIIGGHTGGWGTSLCLSSSISRLSIASASFLAAASATGEEGCDAGVDTPVPPPCRRCPTRSFLAVMLRERGAPTQPLSSRPRCNSDSALPRLHALVNTLLARLTRAAQSASRSAREAEAEAHRARAAEHAHADRSAWFVQAVHECSTGLAVTAAVQAVLHGGRGRRKRGASSTATSPDATPVLRSTGGQVAHDSPSRPSSRWLRVVLPSPTGSPNGSAAPSPLLLARSPQSAERGGFSPLSGQHHRAANAAPVGMTALSLEPRAPSAEGMGERAASHRLDEDGARVLGRVGEGRTASPTTASGGSRYRQSEGEGEGEDFPVRTRSQPDTATTSSRERKSCEITSAEKRSARAHSQYNMAIHLPPAPPLFLSHMCAEADAVVCAIAPTAASTQRRHEVARFITALLRTVGGMEAVLTGTTATGTYLPDTSIDMLIIPPACNLPVSWGGLGRRGGRGGVAGHKGQGESRGEEEKVHASSRSPVQAAPSPSMSHALFMPHAMRRPYTIRHVEGEDERDSSSVPSLDVTIDAGMGAFDLGPGTPADEGHVDVRNNASTCAPSWNPIPTPLTLAAGRSPVSGGGPDKSPAWPKEREGRGGSGRAWFVAANDALVRVATLGHSAGTPTPPGPSPLCTPTLPPNLDADLVDGLRYLSSLTRDAPTQLAMKAAAKAALHLLTSLRKAIAGGGSGEGGGGGGGKLRQRKGALAALTAAVNGAGEGGYEHSRGVQTGEEVSQGSTGSKSRRAQERLKRRCVPALVVAGDGNSDTEGNVSEDEEEGKGGGEGTPLSLFRPSLLRSARYAVRAARALSALHAIPGMNPAVAASLYTRVVQDAGEKEEGGGGGEGAANGDVHTAPPRLYEWMTASDGHRFIVRAIDFSIGHAWADTSAAVAAAASRGPPGAPPPKRPFLSCVVDNIRVNLFAGDARWYRRYEGEGVRGQNDVSGSRSRSPSPVTSTGRLCAGVRLGPGSYGPALEPAWACFFEDASAAIDAATDAALCVCTSLSEATARAQSGAHSAWLERLAEDKKKGAARERGEGRASHSPPPSPSLSPTPVGRAVMPVPCTLHLRLPTTLQHSGAQGSLFPTCLHSPVRRGGGEGAGDFTGIVEGEDGRPWGDVEETRLLLQPCTTCTSGNCASPTCPTSPACIPLGNIFALSTALAHLLPPGSTAPAQVSGSAAGVLRSYTPILSITLSRKGAEDGKHPPSPSLTAATPPTQPRRPHVTTIRRTHLFKRSLLLIQSWLHVEAGPAMGSGRGGSSFHVPFLSSSSAMPAGQAAHGGGVGGGEGIGSGEGGGAVLSIRALEIMTLALFVEAARVAERRSAGVGVDLPFPPSLPLPGLPDGQPHLAHPSWLAHLPSSGLFSHPLQVFASFVGVYGYLPAEQHVVTAQGVQPLSPYVASLGEGGSMHERAVSLVRTCVARVDAVAALHFAVDAELLDVTQGQGQGVRPAAAVPHLLKGMAAAAVEHGWSGSGSGGGGGAAAGHSEEIFGDGPLSRVATACARAGVPLPTLALRALVGRGYPPELADELVSSGWVTPHHVALARAVGEGGRERQVHPHPPSPSWEWSDLARLGPSLADPLLHLLVPSSSPTAPSRVVPAALSSVVLRHALHAGMAAGLGAAEYAAALAPPCPAALAPAYMARRVTFFASFAHAPVQREGGAEGGLAVPVSGIVLHVADPLLPWWNVTAGVSSGGWASFQAACRAAVRGVSSAVEGCMSDGGGGEMDTAAWVRAASTSHLPPSLLALSAPGACAAAAATSAALFPVCRSVYMRDGSAWGGPGPAAVLGWAEGSAPPSPDVTVYRQDLLLHPLQGRVQLRGRGSEALSPHCLASLPPTLRVACGLLAYGHPLRPSALVDGMTPPSSLALHGTHSPALAPSSPDGARGGHGGNGARHRVPMEGGTSAPSSPVHTAGQPPGPLTPGRPGSASSLPPTLSVYSCLDTDPLPLMLARDYGEVVACRHVSVRTALALAVRAVGCRGLTRVSMLERDMEWVSGGGGAHSIAALVSRLAAVQAGSLAFFMQRVCCDLPEGSKAWRSVGAVVAAAAAPWPGGGPGWTSGGRWPMPHVHSEAGRGSPSLTPINVWPYPPCHRLVSLHSPCPRGEPGMTCDPTLLLAGHGPAYPHAQLPQALTRAIGECEAIAGVVKKEICPVVEDILRLHGPGGGRLGGSSLAQTCLDPLPMEDAALLVTLLVDSWPAITAVLESVCGDGAGGAALVPEALLALGGLGGVRDRDKTPAGTQAVRVGGGFGRHLAAGASVVPSVGIPAASPSPQSSTLSVSPSLPSYPSSMSGQGGGRGASDGSSGSASHARARGMRGGHGFAGRYNGGGGPPFSRPYGHPRGGPGLERGGGYGNGHGPPPNPLPWHGPVHGDGYGYGAHPHPHPMPMRPQGGWGGPPQWPQYNSPPGQGGGWGGTAMTVRLVVGADGAMTAQIVPTLASDSSGGREGVPGSGQLPTLAWQPPLPAPVPAQGGGQPYSWAALEEMSHAIAQMVLPQMQAQLAGQAPAARQGAGLAYGQGYGGWGGGEPAGTGSLSPRQPMPPPTPPSSARLTGYAMVDGAPVPVYTDGQGKQYMLCPEQT